MEKNKKSDTIVTAIMIGSVVIAFLWMQLTDAIPYCPSGNVIDESFLNTLKVMTAVKYLVMILGMAGLFVPFIVIRLIRAKKGTRIAVIAIISVTVIILALLVFPFLEGALRGIIDTPPVSTEVVSERYYSSGGMTYNLHFEGGGHAHVSAYHYKKISVGDEVYVVYCDGEPIGVFRTDEYILAN